ncbi:hypothetical protein J6P11_05940 [bacterium]|nr:hypothetical protein [bacterium]
MTASQALIQSVNSGPETNTINEASTNTSSSITLQQAIIDFLQNEINNSNIKFVFNNVSYSVSDILKNISINLPTSISSLNNQNGQIPNVTLSYNSIQLINTSGTSNFIVDGFSPVSALQTGTNYNRYKTIAKTLDSLLNQIIDVSSYDSMSSYTAIDALNNESNSLQDAIRSVIKAEIIASKDQFIVSDIAYSISEIVNAITIKLPSNISLTNNVNAQIPGVTL